MNDKIELWTAFKKLPIDEQVAQINERLKSRSVIQIMGQDFGTTREVLYRYMAKLGYRKVGDSFEKVPEGEVIPNIPKAKQQKNASSQATPSNIDEEIAATLHANTEPAPGAVGETIDKKPAKVKRNPNDLQIYTDVHNQLMKIDTDEYIRTSLSFAKETNEKLNKFLKKYKLLDKQDVITVALEDFIKKYE